MMMAVTVYNIISASKINYNKIMYNFLRIILGFWSNGYVMVLDSNYFI